MFILRLYVLEGCPSCQQALQFIQNKRVPHEVLIANNDPIIAAGNKAMNNGEDKYPVLVCNLTKDVIVGYKEDGYARVCEAVGNLFGGQSWSVSGDTKQSNGQDSATSAQATAGTN